MPLLLDTGALYALADGDDAWHAQMRDFLMAEREPLLVPVTVIPEAAYLIRTRLGERAELLFTQSLAAQQLSVENLAHSDLVRSVELLRQYSFLGFVDASVVAVAERLGVRSLVTTDRRHFSRVRPRHTRFIQLLP